METIFHNQIYGHFLKNLRKKNHKTLNEISSILNMDSSTLSRIENSKTEFSTNKFENLINFYSIPPDYFIYIDHEYSKDIIQFIDYTIEINPLTKNLYTSINEKYKQYKNSVFEIGLHLCNLIYASYTDDYSIISNKAIKSLI